MFAPPVLFAAILSTALFAGACGSPPPAPSNGPKTAVEKQRLEAKVDEPKMQPPKGKKWSGWRYTGDRDNCFYVVGRRCFKARASACEAADCGAKKCEVDGGGFAG
jgi:hypothetical protein